MYGHLSKHSLFATRGIEIIPRPHSLYRTTAAASRSYNRGGCLAQRPAMFKKASQDPPGPANPLFSASSRLNSTASQPSQAAGAKRKFDMTNPSQAALGPLHAAVYFDENDFDDDADLDLGGSTAVPKPAHSTPKTTISNPIIEYPEIPAIPKDTTPLSDVREDIPAQELRSSAPVPWSSSPQSHHLPPSESRPLPGTDEARSLPWKGDKWKYNGAATTPQPKAKPSYPWNKTASAIKEEQKEIRQQHKNRNQVKKPKTTAARPKVPALFLSEEQKAVLEAVVEKGRSIFFTGSAGTGKSVLMREIISKLRERHRREPDRVAVTASTGLAACNIEGVTLHSFAGIGLGKEPVVELVKKIKRNQKARNRWMRTKILVVDEVSMVDGDLFDKLEEIARKIRNNGRPFGGIQLVVTGDFFQLPPVPDPNKEAKFSFDAKTWDTSIQHTILLNHVFRQKDPEFAAMLNEIRLGKLTPATIDSFKSLSRSLDFNDALEATELFPTRNEVDNANRARMQRLSGEVMTFTATDTGSQDPKFRQNLLSSCMAPPVINLKKGAQVMLIKNMEDTLVNGSLGRVAAFMDEATFEYYSKHEEDFNESPDLGESEAVERARKKIKALRQGGGEGPITTAKKWPLVCFLQPDGTERHLLCQPETWKIEQPNGEVQAQRQQVPLILAWALSIHKAQGQTLQRVKVDLGRVFEKGQAYVALSRATAQAGLQVSRFDARRVMVHPRVTEFYANLSSITQINSTKRSESARPSAPPAPPATSGRANEAIPSDVEEDFEEQAYLEHMYG